MRALLSSCAIAVTLTAVSTCGGSKSPAQPTPTRAAVTVTVQNVSSERTATGFVYRYQVRLQETAGVAVTITQSVLTLYNGTTAFGSGTSTGPEIPSPQLAANGTSTVNWELTDDIAGHPHATRLQETVTFTDSVGAQTATGSADVPALPGDQPPPAATFTVSGTVREQGAALSDAQVSINGTSRSTTTDSQGRYAFSGLSSGQITLRATKVGYNAVEQTVNVASDVVVDLTMSRSTPPSQPVPTIQSFSADSTSISLGQSTTLRWSVVNATTVSIDNGIGTVEATGTRQISPTFQSTAYNLTASNTGGNVGRTVTVSVSNSMQCSTVGLPSGTTAVCNDGNFSKSQNRSGTCSTHNGVKCWVCPGPLCNP